MNTYRALFIGSLVLLTMGCRTLPDSGLSAFDPESDSTACDMATADIVKRANEGNPAAASMLRLLGISEIRGAGIMVVAPAVAILTGMPANQDEPATQFSNAVGGGQGKQYDPELLADRQEGFVSGQEAYECCYTQVQGTSPTGTNTVDIYKLYNLLRQETEKLVTSDPAQILGFTNGFLEDFESGDPRTAVQGLKVIFGTVEQALASGNAHSDMRKILGPLSLAYGEALIYEFLAGDSSRKIEQLQQAWELIQQGVGLTSVVDVNGATQGPVNRILWLISRVAAQIPEAKGIADEASRMEQDLLVGGDQIEDVRTGVAGAIDALAMVLRAGADQQIMNGLLTEIKNNTRNLSTSDNNYRTIATFWANAQIVPNSAPSAGSVSKQGSAPKFRVVAQNAPNVATGTQTAGRSATPVAPELLVPATRTIPAAAVGVERVQVPAGRVR